MAEANREDSRLEVALLAIAIQQAGRINNAAGNRTLAPAR
jgi:hypothetical protein